MAGRNAGRPGVHRQAARHAIHAQYNGGFVFDGAEVMTVSMRLKPDIAKLLDRECKRRRVTRTALIHDALDAYLRPQRPRLGDVIREVLADSPDGLGLQRMQPEQVDARDWGR
jgi:predicted transcriptional regulator